MNKQIKRRNETKKIQQIDFFSHRLGTPSKRNLKTKTKHTWPAAEAPNADPVLGTKFSCWNCWASWLCLWRTWLFCCSLCWLAEWAGLDGPTEPQSSLVPSATDAGSCSRSCEVCSPSILSWLVAFSKFSSTCEIETPCNSFPFFFFEPVNLNKIPNL